MHFIEEMQKMQFGIRLESNDDYMIVSAGNKMSFLHSLEAEIGTHA